MSEYTSEELAQASDILGRATELTMATLRPDGAPHASTASFANKGLTVYLAVAIGSQKACNIQYDSRVAFTANMAYRNWDEIRGLSVDATAHFVTGDAELKLASSLLWQKYPQFASVISNPDILPWPGMVFIRCDPTHVALLDYAQGFGHTVHFRVDASADGLQESATR